MATLTQKGKPLRLTTPLGPDVLLLERMVMDEGVSRPFSLQLELLSLNTSIDTKDILRKQVTVEIDLADGSTRYVNGVVRRFSQHERDKGLVTYRAEVVPSIWLLSLSSDCRVFQNMTTTEIVKKVFDEAGFKDYKVNVTGAQGTREYCVQYRESHLDFVSRLLEEEGIFYFFEHTSKANTIVLADAPSAIKPAMVARMSMTVAMSAETGEDTIDELEIGSVVTSAKVTLLDYNDQTTKKISTSIAGTATAYGLAKSEVFDYPGEFAVVGDGERIARVRMDELEAQTHSIRGRTLSRGLASGQKLTVADHYRTDVNGAYHLLTLHHEGTVGDYVSGGGEAFSYSATFMGIPALVPFRPARVTPKSIVHGTQTAVVVGPSGEEIYVDKYGRVKVQFFWDREGTMDDKSSCWVRVSNAWAGKQWGFIQIPRIGQEVIVDFLEGDPDRPIITGRVYNGDLMPPYVLPDNGTQSGLKTRSTKGGSASTFNELRFEDKKDSEEVYLHSQKDFNAVTEHDETWKVLHDRTTTIKNDETKVVQEGNELTTIAKGTRTVAVSVGDQTHTVDTGKDTITVEGDRTITIKTGKHSLIVKTGDMITEVDTGDQSNTVKTGNLKTEVKTGNATMKVGLGLITYEAMQSIELKVGPSSIKIAPDGITIKGMQVKIEGSAMVEMKAPMTTVKADGVLTLKGGVTMIN